MCVDESSCDTCGKAMCECEEGNSPTVYRNSVGSQIRDWKCYVIMNPLSVDQSLGDSHHHQEKKIAGQLRRHHTQAPHALLCNPFIAPSANLVAS